MKKVSANLNQMSLLFGGEDDLAVMDVVIEKPKKPLTTIAKAVQIQVSKPVFVLRNHLDTIKGKGQKIEANLSAIRLLNEKQGSLSDAEKAVLVKYTGWGGATSAFDLEKGGAQAAELKSLLSDTQYASARSSVLTAYFTEPFVIREIWRLLAAMGFDGGNIVETSAGVGHFIGAMPEEIRSKSSITMVEPDRISASILNRVYDEKDVMVFGCGIEKAPLKSGSFDLAISNVPFGQYKVNDNKFNQLKLMIHDYFFAKGLDLVRAGGLVAFITSTGTLDKQRDSFRAYLAEKADLVTAIRLPSGTFNRLGETDVVTDIIVLRKKPLIDDERSGLAFKNVVKGGSLCENVYDSYLPNEVFLSGGQHLGRAAAKRGKFGVEYPVKGDAAAMLPGTVHRLREELAGWYQPRAEGHDAVTLVNPLTNSISSGYFLTETDEVGYIGPNGESESCQHLPAKTYERLVGMVRVRDLVRGLIEDDVVGKDTAQQREQLNRTYDMFVKNYGNLLSDVNRRAFSLDSYAPLLWSLEHYDEEKDSYKKAAIFSRCTVSRNVLSDTAGSLADAIALSFNRFGRLDITFMASALSAEQSEVVQELLETGRAVMEPGTGDLVEIEQYLSGNVRAKLVAAICAAERDPRYERNVRALQEVVPVTVPMKHISVRMGAPWIPAEDIERFVQEVVYEAAGDDLPCNIIHSPVMASWVVEARVGKRTPIATNDWGTDRRDFFDLLQTALNQQQPTVYDTVEVDGKDRQVVNQEHTTAARAKMEKIADSFAAWISQSEERAKRLEEVYNNLFNSTVNREYDGSHLVIPGFNPTITLRASQKDVIWRGIVSGNMLIAKAVGGGKTLDQIVLAQESKRLGLANKPCLVVPNHMLEAFAGEYLRAFPLAKILAASKADLEGDKRRTLMMRIATGNWDAIIITHSSFGRIAVSKEAMADFADDVTNQLDDAVMDARQTSERNDIREIERTRKTIVAKIEAMCEKECDRTVLPFDQLGIDMLLVDEADLFKNLWFHTKRTRVAGLPQVASQRAWDMFMKSRLVFERTGSSKRGLVFSTATPVSNTLAEVYTMQRYLQEDALRDANIATFDAWAANFAREVTSIEVAPDGSRYRMHTRFAQFVNVPELMLIFRQVASIMTKKMLNLPVPKLAGGKHTVVAVPARPELKEFVQTLMKRADAIRNGSVKPDEDNMLCVTGDGRKAALDMRLISRDFGDAPVTKLNACVENVYQHWVDGEGQKLTQLIFSDIGTPGTDRFSVYEDIRTKLVAKGVPNEEIAFAQDFKTDRQKGELHRKLRCGKIRIAIGSTELMGFGTNVQDLLVAQHQIDVPWRPRDIEQRDGRIERQGNRNKEVFIYRYVTEGSFDTYMWQTNETKARFIESLWENDGSSRSVEDVSSQALSCAEVKALASGNPLVIEKAGIDAEVAKLWSLQTVYHEGKRNMDLKRLYAQDAVRHNKAIAVDAEKDIEACKGVEVNISIPGEPEDVAREIRKKISVENELSAQCERKIILFKASGLTVNCRAFYKNVDLSLSGLSGRSYALGRIGGLTLEMVYEWATNLPRMLEDKKQEALSRVTVEEGNIAALDKQIARDFEYAERLEIALERQRVINDSLDLNRSDANAEVLTEA